MIEMTPETIVREIVATEIHRMRLLNILEKEVGKPVLNPDVFRYSNLSGIVSVGGQMVGLEFSFGEGFNLTNESVDHLLIAAFT